MTQEYLTRAEFWLLITTLLYFLMNGAQLMETFIIIPKWTIAPPESFQLFKGKYGLDFKIFWVILHSIHDISFCIAISRCTNIDSVILWLLLLFGLHVGVRIWTLFYFAPKIIEFQKIANESTIVTPFASSDLLERTTKWRNLNYFRVGFYFLVSIGVLLVYLHVKALIV